MSLCLLLLLTAQTGADLPTIEIDEPLAGSVEAGDPVLYAEEEAPLKYVGKSFRLAVEKPGTYRILLESMAFEPGLLLRDAGGKLIAAGGRRIGSGLNPYVEVEVPQSSEFRIDACAREGRSGLFQLRVTTAPLPSLSIEEQRALESEDARARLGYAEEVYGAESAEHAQTLTTTARRLSLYGAILPEEALDRMQMALGILREVLGPTHWDTRVCLNDVGIAMLDLGQVADAKRAFEEVLAMDVETFGPDHPKTAWTRVNLAAALFSLGDNDEVRSQCERVLEHEGSYGDTVFVSVAHTLMAKSCKAQADLESAEHHLRRAYEVSRKANGVEDPITYMQQVYLGEILAIREKVGEARPLVEEACAGLSRVLGRDHFYTAEAFTVLCDLQYRLGEFEGSIGTGRMAIATFEKILGPDCRNLLGPLDSVGLAQYALEDYAAARRTLERSRDISDRVFGSNSSRSILTQLNISAIRLSLGEAGEVVSELRATLELQEQLLGLDHPDLALTRNSLAYALILSGDPEGAMPLLESALEALERRYGRGHEETKWSLRGLVESLSAMDRREEAWELWHQHRTERVVVVGRTLAALTESERVAFLSAASGDLRCLVDLAAGLRRPEIHEQAYAAVLGWKGWSTRLLLAGRKKLAAETNPGTRELLEQLRSAQADLAALAYDERAAKDGPYAEQLEELRRLRNETELDLQRSLGTVVDEESTPAELRACLPPKSAAVDFLVQDHLHAWVSRPDRSGVAYLDLGPAASAAEAVRDHLRAIQDGTEVEERLRALLWNPLAAELGDAQLVFVSPDRFLGGLPLETIPLEDGRFLIEERSFVYLQDLSSLPSLVAAETTGRYDTLLVCGGLDFDGRSTPVTDQMQDSTESFSLRGSFTTEWPALPGTVAEANRVAQQYGEWSNSAAEALLLSGTEATEERIKLELPRHAVLHLATHGYFQPEGLPSMWSEAVEQASRGEPPLLDQARRLTGLHPGLLTGLVWAGANAPPEEGRDDGYLTAEELQWLDLSRVELMVLSACETAVGRPREGEGMIGLHRACRLAGARTVVSSLWRVADDSTGRLMEEFYENLWGKRMGRLEALRAAQLGLLERHHPPSAWGAFILSGDWR